jgi:uncharacterized delta-60 repeat protein
MNNRALLYIGAWMLFACTGIASAQAVIQLDAAFGLNGRIAVELGVKNSAHAVVVQPDGRIVVGGSSSQGAALNFSLIRFHQDGALDTSFNGEGSVVTSIAAGDDEILALGLLSDGRIVAAGYRHNGTDRDFTLACYLQDGRLDRAFGHNGVVVTPIGSGNEEITALTVNARDMITVAGTVEGTAGRVLATARYYADGELDQSYGEQGVSIIGIGEDATAEGIIERPDGSSVISGTCKEKKGTSLMLVGLSLDGILDRSFGVKGVGVPSGSLIASEGYRLTADRNGLLYVAGSVGSAGKRDTALFRFTTTGKPDVSFGNQGMLITKVSEADDVLYDVTVAQNGVVGSGYTTDVESTRQFLLINYAEPSASVPVSTGMQATSTKRINFGVSKSAPIEEVRVNGNTKVLIRRLQISPSYSDYTTVRSIPAASAVPSSWPSIAQNRSEIFPIQTAPSTAFAPNLPAVLQRFGDFLVPSAVAAEIGDAVETKGSVVATVATASFSEGGSVSYAVVADAQGNIIVVGTADGIATSSIVAARYAAESQSESSNDQPGQASRHILTTTVTGVTRTSATVGGEVAPAFGKTVTKRGVVFSVSKDPVCLALAAGTNAVFTNSVELGAGRHHVADGLRSSAPSDTAGLLDRLSLNALSGWLVADAVAASASSGNTAQNGFVEQGETIDGSGYGRFDAVLEQLKPGTVYFYRAYALTSDGSVYYGNQVSFSTADTCFVATASFGTLLHPSVKVLRDFRDVFLLNNTPGQRLVALYYTLSPPLADGIAQNALLRFAVRVLLLPVVGFSWLALQAGMAAALAILVGSALVFGQFASRVWMRR